MEDILKKVGIMGDERATQTEITAPSKSPKKELQIDSVALFECCNFSFKKNKENKERLIELIRNRTGSKDFARVALLLQEHKILTTDWNRAAFTKWYKHFCNIVGCTHNAAYNPKKIKDDIFNKLNTAFYHS